MITLSPSYSMIKFCLLSAAFMLITTIIIWPMFSGSSANLSFIQYPKLILGGVKMEGVSLQGIDEYNRPFIITSTTLERKQDIPYLTVLGEVDATLDMDNGDALLISGQLGIANDKKQMIFLEQGVIVRDNENKLTTSEANLNLVSGDIIVDGEVNNIGHFIDFTSEAMHIKEKGLHVLLLGKSQLQLH